MDTLSSSYLPTFHRMNNIPFVKVRIENSSNSRSKIMANSCFITSQPIKKLISYIEKFTYKNPQVSQEVILVHERTRKSFLAIVFKLLDDCICTFMDLPLHPSVDPKIVLSGNFAPVDELPPTACEVVEGSLPSCLDGAYIRNGPNPQFIPTGPYHLFDGDGMLHSIKISQGKATFCSRYVETYKYVTECTNGYPFFPSVFSSFNGFTASMARCVLSVARVLTMQFSPMTKGFGLANTSLSYFSGKLFALGESDLPYEVKVTSEGDVITLGRHDFHSTKPFMNMTAHPKIDPDSNEMFAFSYNLMSPFLTYFRISSDGKKQKDVPIYTLKRASFIHDFAVTKNYAIFPDLQIVIDPLEIMKGRSPVGVDPTKTPRLGIMPKYTANEFEMCWIDVPGLNMLHAVNAWEEEDGKKIVIVGSNVLSVEHSLDQMNLIHLSLEIIIVNVLEKKAVRHSLSPQSLDFGAFNPSYVGKKNKYIYAGITAPMPKISGLVKLDLSLLTTNHCDCAVASRLYGPGYYGGEPFFVPREPDNRDADEDHGYIVTYVHNENTEESWFLVLDAKSPNLDIVANVRLPGRVPYGFHGLFVRQSHLNTQ